MEKSLIDLFNSCISWVQEPLLNALDATNPFEYIYKFLNDLINSILNIFGKNNMLIEINNYFVSQFFSALLTITILVVIIKLFRTIFLAFTNAFSSISFSNDNNNKEWRKQWKRKKKKYH